MLDQDVEQHKELETAAQQPDTEATPESDETTDELSPEERGLQMIRAHKQVYRQRIEDAKAKIRTRGEWRRAKRLGQTYRYTVQPGDTLATVAKIFYAKPERWPEIYEANAERIPGPADAGPQALEPGMELVIP